MREKQGDIDLFSACIQIYHKNILILILESEYLTHLNCSQKQYVIQQTTLCYLNFSSSKFLSICLQQLLKDGCIEVGHKTSLLVCLSKPEHFKLFITNGQAFS